MCTDSPELVGAKAHGLMLLQRLGLPVPPGFVVTTEACRAFLAEGRHPAGFAEELTTAVAGLEATTGRRLGGTPPLAVSVRSGASVSMPGMMNTVLGLGLTTEATAELAEETGDTRFALDSRRRFLTTFAAAGHDTGTRWDHWVPDDAARQLELAIDAVFTSWNTPRARAYRELHGIDDDLGTAVIVQAMVFGNRDERSGTGVAFSRDPGTGENTPSGDVLFGGQGDDVVSGRTTPLPLSALARREPAVWAELLGALRRIEAGYREPAYVEFTYQKGELSLLQTRRALFTGAAAVRCAVDFADERLITRSEALLRVSPRHLELARTPRIAPSADVLASGAGASPGVAVGMIATTTETAVRMAADGEVILARPETSPHDMRGLAAAKGIITARGGAASHAAVVARSLGKPAVVGISGLTVDDVHGTITVAGHTIREGTLVTVDGGTGRVALGAAPVVSGTTEEYPHRLLAWADDVSGDRSRRDDAERLDAGRAKVRANAEDGN
ncbi:pyruvate, phosphate dikinase [Prauserella marina]|uniref:pyruvate, phosphate dikinase n=1 Tax=Prauserella marina TaxID=530584 RepID=UPI001FEBCC64|nr:pyruvate, phosphate dikinase [Prauserella marina]